MVFGEKDEILSFSEGFLNGLNVSPALEGELLQVVEVRESFDGEACSEAHSGHSADDECSCDEVLELFFSQGSPSPCSPTIRRLGGLVASPSPSLG